MTASVVIWSTLAPWLLLVWVLQRVLPWRGWVGLAVAAVAGAVLLWILWFGRPLPYWSAALGANFSVTMALLLAVGIAQRASRKTWFGRREWRVAWVFGAVAALLLYPSALGLGPRNFDAYALGWPWLFRGQSLFLFGGAGITAAALILRGNRFGLVLLVALLTFSTGFQESDNLWDYLLDPVYGAVSLLAVLWMLVIRSRRRAGDGH